MRRCSPMKMKNIRMLLDTNVLIQTEDNQKIESNFAELLEKCQQHGIRLFLHDGTIEDINRDPNLSRREITLSKVRKYPLLEKIPSPNRVDLEENYGSISKDNDYIDAKLLHALNIKAVNFLVTEDNGIHTRAKRAGLEDQVLLVSEAVGWIRQTYEPKSIKLPHVVSLKCHQVDVSQRIFQTLKGDYPGFEEWFSKCIEQHRDCWTVQEEDTIIAIAILKEETGQDFKSDFVEGTIDAQDNDNVLKICTFKVGIDARGSKIGEHLLKQALWHSYENNFDWVYLTAFEEKQFHLIAFLEEFGFAVHGKNGNGELVLAKPVVKGEIKLGSLSPLDCHKKFYPNYYDGEDVQKFFVPIQPQFHLKLFPEYTSFEQPMLFTPQDVSKIREEISGNTIRKVYLSRAKTNALNVGDLVFFYMSKNDVYQYSQCLTIVGVVDGVTECNNLEELLEVTAKRSVYSHSDLEAMFAAQTTPVKAMDFLIAGHLKTNGGKPPDLEKLEELSVIKGRPPQSIAKLDEDQYQNLKQAIKVVHGSEGF